MTIPKHFLDISDFDGKTLNAIIAKARAMKDARKGSPRASPRRTNRSRAACWR